MHALEFSESNSLSFELTQHLRAIAKHHLIIVAAVREVRSSGQPSRAVPRARA